MNKAQYIERLVKESKPIYPHNYYLAKIFFNTDHPETYIPALQGKNSRYERLEKLK